jgi:hypothetical protein
MPTSRKSDPDNGALRVDQGPHVDDPSTRTYQQILRENFWLRELLETRLNAIESAMMLLQSYADRTPTTSDVHHNVEQLREAAELRFEGVKTQISERDATYKQDSTNVAIAVKTAFDSAKEVVTKSEGQFRELFQGINISRESERKAVDGVINDIKERVTRIESKAVIIDPQNAVAINQLSTAVQTLRTGTDMAGGAKAAQAAMIAMIMSIFGLIIGIGSAIGLLLKSIR